MINQVIAQLPRPDDLPINQLVLIITKQTTTGGPGTLPDISRDATALTRHIKPVHPFEQPSLFLKAVDKIHRELTIPIQHFRFLSETVLQK